MPSKITDLERELIDRAIEAGNVTKIKRGQSGFAYVYDPKIQKIVVDKSRSTSKLVWSGHFKLTPELSRRRNLVRQYYEEGLSLKMITERIKEDGFVVESNHIKADLRVMNLKPLPHAEIINRQRLKDFWRFFNDGVYRHKDLAALMDISEATLQKFLTKNGIVLSLLRTAPAGNQKSGQHKSGSVPE